MHTPFIHFPFCTVRRCASRARARHISKYYTEDFRTGRNWVHSDTGQSWIAPATGRDGSATPGEFAASERRSKNINGDTNDSNENPSTRGSGQGGRQGGHHFRPVSRQVARNLVKPLHPSTLALPSPFSRTFPPTEGAGGEAEIQPRIGSTSTLTASEAAVANECLVSLLAVHGTTSRLAALR